MIRMPNEFVLLIIGALVAMQVVTPSTVRSQPLPKMVRIPDAPTCSTCSVTLQPIVTLGGIEGPGEFDWPPISIRQDRQGRFWVLPGDMELPRIYSAKGVFAGTVGRKGSGPGEYSGVSSLTNIPGDSMLVVDAMASRATILSGDLKLGRSMIFPRGVNPEFVIDWPKSVMLNGWISSTARAGLQFHMASLADREPQILKSYTPDSTKWRSQSDLARSARVVPAKDGFWSYHPYRYRFSRWSLDGKIVADFERDASWFPRLDRVMAIGNMTTPPPSTFVSVVPQDDQRVWSIVNVSSPNWKQAWERVNPLLPEVPGRIIALENLFHTIVEEIDLKSGRVLSRTRTNKWIIAALDGGRVAAYELDLQGLPRVVIYSLVRKQ